MPERDESVHIPGDELKVSLDKALQVSGDPGRQYLPDGLQNHGMIFDKEHSYTLDQLRSALSIIGDDGALLVVERLRKELAKPS